MIRIASVFNDTFYNISVTSWQSVLSLEELTGNKPTNQHIYQTGLYLNCMLSCSYMTLKKFARKKIINPNIGYNESKKLFSSITQSMNLTKSLIQSG
jgi:hypothetical protein